MNCFYLLQEIPSSEIAGPSFKPSKKIKLKAPADDLSTMVRLKKKKEKPKETEEIEAPVANATETIVSTEPEITALPAYKINLKKSVKDNTKMKGASLNLLGGYGSSDSD